MWMVHAMDEDGRKQTRDHRRGSGELRSHPVGMDFQPQAVDAHTHRLDPQKTLNHSPQGNASPLKRKYTSAAPEGDERIPSRQRVGDYETNAEVNRRDHPQTSATPSKYYNPWNKRRDAKNFSQTGTGDPILTQSDRQS